MKSKKGAIEMSMTTIIVIVLGVTLLILGLAFVRNIFGKTEQLGLQAFEQADKEIQSKMGSTEKFYVSGGFTWTVDPGTAVGRLVVIQNFDENLDSSGDFKVEIKPTDKKGSETWFVISQPGKIKAGEKAKVPIEVRLPKGLPPGTSYSFVVKVYKNNQEYESQSIIVSVKD